MRTKNFLVEPQVTGMGMGQHDEMGEGTRREGQVLEGDERKEMGGGTDCGGERKKKEM